VTHDPIDRLIAGDAVRLASEVHLVRLDARPLDADTLLVYMKALEALSDPRRNVRQEVIRAAREIVLNTCRPDEMTRALATFDWIVEAAFGGHSKGSRHAPSHTHSA